MTGFSRPTAAVPAQLSCYQQASSSTTLGRPGWVAALAVAEQSSAAVTLPPPGAFADTAFRLSCPVLRISTPLVLRPSTARVFRLPTALMFRRSSSDVNARASGSGSMQGRRATLPLVVPAAWLALVAVFEQHGGRRVADYAVGHLPANAPAAEQEAQGGVPRPSGPWPCPAPHPPAAAAGEGPPGAAGVLQARAQVQQQTRQQQSPHPGADQRTAAAAEPGGKACKHRRVAMAADVCAEGRGGAGGATAAVEVRTDAGRRIVEIKDL